MRSHRVLKRISQYGLYLPIRLYGILFIAALWGGRYWINTQQPLASGYFQDIALVLTNMVEFAVLAYVSFSIVSLGVAYSYFLYCKKKQKLLFSITQSRSDAPQNRVLKMVLKPILKPLFGNVQLRLYYNEGFVTAPFALTEPVSFRLFGNSIEGLYEWPRKEIKTYQIKKVYLFFKDPFFFFSLTGSFITHCQFTIAPQDQAVLTTLPRPAVAEETNIRTDELRKVKGEYLNYKNFESQDDVRRIVWKIYAKNKELVVRIPETLDTYSSHLNLFVSFFKLPKAKNSLLDRTFLHYYKQQVWNVYKSLNRSEIRLNFFFDQPHVHSSENGKDIKKFVAEAQWHRAEAIDQYVNPQQASVVVVSSFTDWRSIETLLGAGGKKTVFVFIKLTQYIHRKKALDWVRWLFFRTAPSELKFNKTQWRLSPLRWAVENNEKKIEALLKNNEPHNILTS